MVGYLRREVVIVLRIHPQHGKARLHSVGAKGFHKSFGTTHFTVSHRTISAGKTNTGDNARRWISRQGNGSEPAAGYPYDKDVARVDFGQIREIADRGACVSAGFRRSVLVIGMITATYGFCELSSRSSVTSAHQDYGCPSSAGEFDSHRQHARGIHGCTLIGLARCAVIDDG